ncbi:MAG TPA: TonB-dependent receptor [Kofleriaceae bacterium]|nr:TonB-dependent receptor [Kofleriaceae bacterium]
MNKLSKIFMATALALGAGSLIDTSEVSAQASSTVGSLRGVLKDKATGETAVGATVVATSPSLVGEQVVITDENGAYFISSLPPGVYTLTIYYNDKPFSRGNVLIQVGKEAVVNVTVDSAAGKPGGEVIEIRGNAPIIDQGSTKTSVTVTEDYTRNIPTGRTFGGVLGSVSGSQSDLYGTSIGGATSAENVYVVEGINTTDTAFGGLSSNLPNEFISETEVITGGYNAEFGRATGGIVNVVTKQGSNQFKGSVFGYVTPGALVADAEVIRREGQSIDSTNNLDYRYDFGAEVGGPIIKDKLWFHVGFNPSIEKRTITRIVKSLRDDNMDGAPDTDPDTGLTIADEVASRDLETRTSQYFYTAKINGAINQNNQFQISAFGSPRSGDALLALTRNPENAIMDREDGAYDVAAKWTSKFNDGKTQVDAVLGFHRGFENELPKTAAQDQALIRFGFTRSLYDFEALEGGAATIGKCNDNDPNDPYKTIRNCPVLNYASQGLGFLEERTNDRSSLVLSATHRLKAAGYHTFKIGVDAELATYNSKRGFTGGAFLTRRANSAAGAPGSWQLREYMRFKENMDLEPGDQLCAGDRAVCTPTPFLKADTDNTSLAGFLQDSWQIRPNFTLNAGLRWEQQTGYVAEALRGGKLTPEGETIPDEAYKLSNLLAPRLGFIYDPTSEGKSKLFGHWGRFYENVPMDLNVRAFGGEITNFTNLNPRRLTADQEGYDPNCNVDFSSAAGGDDLSKTILQCTDRTQQALLGEGVEYVSPGLKGQFTQELILGAEYEFAADFTLGMNYIHRSLPQVIEDVSTDGGNTYMITNPGEDFSGEAAELRRMAAEVGGDLAKVYESRAKLLDYVQRFDKPTRDYDALALTARQRPTKRSLLQASYTYAVSKGNYAGLFSTETGQLDPNLTSLYDLPDLMANRYGNLGLDRPHNLKIDGFYQFDLKKAGVLTAGASFRAISGIAHNALGSHPTYGSGEAYLLPRGAFARSPVTTNFDVQLGYGYKVNKNTLAEGFIRVFNLLDSQDELNVDENYTFDNAVPIVGGTSEDLKHVKAIDPISGLETASTVTPNKNFNNLSSRQSPRSIQLGFRLTF